MESPSSQQPHAPAPQWLPGADVSVDPLAPAPEQRPARRRRGRRIAVIVLVVALLVGVAAVVGEWATRTAETDAMLDQVERSEAAMVAAMTTVAEAVAAEGAYDGGLSPEAARELSRTAVAARAEVLASSDALAGIAVQPWHADIDAARDAYLAHSAAWQAFLARAQANPGTWFEEDADITTTWEAFTARLPQAVPTPALPSLESRVEEILDEGDRSDEDGGTLEA